ncbi:MAG: hypothetical protein K1X75_01315 [Leptospirales bacterium]|nr:hypothetical protein [Leptospirales bacterium]
MPDRNDIARLMWQGSYAILRVPAARFGEALRLGQVAANEAIIVDSTAGILSVRIPADRRADLEALGFAFENSPPFRYIDPLIELRRSSSRPADWQRGYMDEELAWRSLRRMAADFPELTRLQELGRSHQGRPILALRISDDPGNHGYKPAVLYLGAQHGNEPLAVNFPLDLAYYVLYGCDAQVEDACSSPILEQTSSRGVLSRRSLQLQKFLRDYELWIVPVANPDGVHAFWEKNVWSGRKNGRDNTEPRGWNSDDGVDLNRNYPFFWNSGIERASSGEPRSIFYRGPSPASEPETQAIMALTSRVRFAIALSYHCFATRVLAPYTIEGAHTPVPSASWRMGEELARAGQSYRPEKAYEVAHNLYAVDGTDQDWMFQAYGVMAFIVEGAQLHPPFEPAGRLTIQGMRSLSLRALQLIEEGPVVQVQVVDQNDRPLEARLRTPQHYYFHNEALYTSPRNGRYNYFLEFPAELQIRASRDGYQSAEAKVDCQSGICPLRLQLTPLAAH